MNYHRLFLAYFWTTIEISIHYLVWVQFFAPTLPSEPATQQHPSSRSSFLRSLPQPKSTSQDDCAYCKASLTDPAQLPCGHVFCRACLRELVDHGWDRCLLCQQAFFISNTAAKVKLNLWSKELSTVCLVAAAQTLLENNFSEMSPTLKISLWIFYAASAAVMFWVQASLQSQLKVARGRREGMERLAGNARHFFIFALGLAVYFPLYCELEGIEIVGVEWGIAVFHAMAAVRLGQVLIARWEMV